MNLAGRVLTQSGVMLALGRARQAKGRQYYDGDVNLPAFLTAKNLKPFIAEGLAVTSSQIEFLTLGGVRAFGYDAGHVERVRPIPRALVGLPVGRYVGAIRWEGEGVPTAGTTPVGWWDGENAA